MQTPNQILAETILSAHTDGWERLKTLALDNPAFEVRRDHDGAEVILVRDFPEAGWLTVGPHIVFAYRLDAALQFSRFEADAMPTAEDARLLYVSIEQALDAAHRLVPRPA